MGGCGEGEIGNGQGGGGARGGFVLGGRERGLVLRVVVGSGGGEGWEGWGVQAPRVLTAWRMLARSWQRVAEKELSWSAGVLLDERMLVMAPASSGEY